MNNKKNSTSDLVIMALLSTITIVLAFTPFIGYIPLGFTRATVVHIPVIIGSMMLGAKKGAVLGGIFGATSLINNTFNPTATSFVFTPFFSIGNINGGFYSLIICFIPRILVGVFPYFIYKLITSKKSEPNRRRNVIALSLSGIIGSLTNTILVMSLILTLFADSYANVQEISEDTIYTFVSGIIAINGIPEAIASGLIITGVGLALSKTKFSFYNRIRSNDHN